MVAAPGVTVTISPFAIPSARLRQERGDRRCQERLAVADPDDEGTLLARRDQRFGVIGVQGRERVMTAQVTERKAYRFSEIPGVVLFDQVGDDLGIGLRAEQMALVAQRVPELGVVLDDPVEHDVDRVRAVTVRMGVLLRDTPVGRPPGVAEPDGGRGNGWRRDRDPALLLTIAEPNGRA